MCDVWTLAKHVLFIIPYIFNHIVLFYLNTLVVCSTFLKPFIVLYTFCLDTDKIFPNNISFELLN